MDWFGPLSGGLLGILIFGCFVQVITLLSLLRYGLGLNGFDFGIVNFLLAFVLSCLMVEAKFGITSTLERTVEGSGVQFSQVLDSKVKPFMESATEPQIAQRLRSLSASIEGSSLTASPQAQERRSLAETGAGFILTQLKRSLTLGLMLLVPLVLIDFMVGVVITMVGIPSLSSAVVSIPLKLLLFVVIDGWTLVINKLLLGF
jgi:flagellar biosynthetic protein FliP